MTMRQLRQASQQGYNIVGRSHENLQGNTTSPYLGQHHGSVRKEPLRRYASAHTLPISNPPSAVQYRGSATNIASAAPVLRISGDFEDMWNRQHLGAMSSSAAAQHKPVFGRGIGCM